jgi:hypothetical protein
MNDTVTDRVAVLEINRPERMNAWTPTLEATLRVLLVRADEDPDVHCLVLAGAGRAFCAGADMGGMGQSAAVAAATSSDEDIVQRYGYILGFSKPLIAAINGPAAGVGVCLSLYCDIRYVAAGARMTLPYARRGLVAEHGLAWRLPGLFGPHVPRGRDGPHGLGQRAARRGLSECRHGARPGDRERHLAEVRENHQAATVRGPLPDARRGHPGCGRGYRSLQADP